MGLQLQRAAGRGLAARRLALISVLSLIFFTPQSSAQRRRRSPAASGRVAVVVDERLSALRDAPSLSAGVSRRIGRGRLVAVAGTRETADGVTFYRVFV